MRIKEIKKTPKNIILIPEVKIKIAQLRKIKIVCPISGWIANKIATIDVVRKEKKYLIKILLYFRPLKIKLITIIKNGLTSSIGWNLGKKNKSIHLLDPLTSIPMKGTKTIKKIENKKIIGEILKSFFSSSEEREKIITIPSNTNNKCLKKNK